MDSYGTFLERRVFTASQTHYVPQHGLADTPDKVGDSSAQPCRLQSFSTSSQPARDAASCGERQVVAGLTQRKKRYHALTTAEVLRWLKLVPTHLELQIRCPRWWQSLLLDREGNEALLGILFFADWERKLKDHCWTMAIFLRMVILGRCS